MPVNDFGPEFGIKIRFECTYLPTMCWEEMLRGCYLIKAWRRYMMEELTAWTEKMVCSQGERTREGSYHGEERY